ncbi:MAG: hypothetical protein P1U74_00090 [Legionellaceae bacterium]|nr:hypothetical protein [Legionellaceae bacterium]
MFNHKGVAMARERIDLRQLEVLSINISEHNKYIDNIDFNLSKIKDEIKTIETHVTQLDHEIFSERKNSPKLRECVAQKKAANQEILNHKDKIKELYNQRKEIISLKKSKGYVSKRDDILKQIFEKTYAEVVECCKLKKHNWSEKMQKLVVYADDIQIYGGAYMEFMYDLDSTGLLYVLEKIRLERDDYDDFDDLGMAQQQLFFLLGSKLLHDELHNKIDEIDSSNSSNQINCRELYNEVRNYMVFLYSIEPRELSTQQQINNMYELFENFQGYVRGFSDIKSPLEEFVELQQQFKMAKLDITSNAIHNKLVLNLLSEFDTATSPAEISYSEMYKGGQEFLTYLSSAEDITDVNKQKQDILKEALASLADIAINPKNKKQNTAHFLTLIHENRAVLFDDRSNAANIFIRIVARFAAFCVRRGIIEDNLLNSINQYTGRLFKRAVQNISIKPENDENIDSDLNSKRLN